MILKELLPQAVDRELHIAWYNLHVLGRPDESGAVNEKDFKGIPVHVMEVLRQPGLKSGVGTQVLLDGV
jgi:hypothetical protein